MLRKILEAIAMLNPEGLLLQQQAANQTLNGRSPTLKACTGVFIYLRPCADPPPCLLARYTTTTVCVNYSNATADATMSPQEIGMAYASATTTSVGLAVGLNAVVPRLQSLSPQARTLLGRFVPFVAVASAGCVNVGLMRWKEIKEGNDIFPPATPEDPSPKSLGKSTKAGFTAVSQTAASRVLCNMCAACDYYVAERLKRIEAEPEHPLSLQFDVSSPTLILPPLAMAALSRRGVFSGPNGRKIETAAELSKSVPWNFVQVRGLPFVRASISCCGQCASRFLAAGQCVLSCSPLLARLKGRVRKV